ncbi:DUF4489 domain-containing protein [Tepidimicrobium xylanilyticum]|uniref:DUF4489 domain-containing protein n=1 Tax=Tepidimicrobium xylanilyticum TaxID=1123352 RepID=A0A1H2SKI4_9FIRM|nr:DUF4489 domain-containing protein [Tepidimicrobium xylanilyticum]GMG96191.1 hypothetical protein EN5CB1_10170 [Tepidimicrobium xylanilyticum]SDW32048.1 protein of unknown function [Tepidimicrobium xylanilyticum]
MAVYYQPGYRPSKCKCGKQDCDCHSSIDCRPDKIISNCNNLTGASGVSIVAIGETITPRNIGSLSITGLKCFKRPSIRLDITAIITLNAALAVDTVITFRVFKRCGNEPETEIQSFEVAPGIALVAGASIPVAFSICDHNICLSQCCTYRVTVEATAAVALAAALNINQGTISALATDLC